jgi:S-adenosylmethionine decarboxylase
MLMLLDKIKTMSPANLLNSLSSYKQNKLRPYKQTVKPSKHCMGTLVVADSSLLFDGLGCLNAVKLILKDNETITLGEQLHKFPNGSFSLLIALAESHISIHTWPERQTVQLDVFLCNYIHDNNKRCQNIYNDIVDYFDTLDANTTIIDRL